MMQNLVVILAAAAMIGYPAYAYFRQERSLSNLSLLAALGVTAILSLLDIWVLDYAPDFLRIKNVALVFEGLLCPFWLIFSLVYSRNVTWKTISLTQKIILLLSVVPPLFPLVLHARELFYSPDFSMEHTLFLEKNAWFFYLQISLFLTIALFNLEATIANAAHAKRWKIKFAVIGAGFIIGAHVLYFSQSFVFRALDMTLVHFRSIASALGVVFIAYSHHRRGSDVRITISKSLAYKSVVMFMGGLFLVMVGLFGEGMKHFGEEFNRYVVFVIGLGGCAGLIIVVMSETVRRKFRVMIQRNFYKEKYDYRVQWKEFTERLSEARSRDALFRSILSGYCETFGIVGGTFYLRNQTAGEMIPVAFLEMDENQVVFPLSDHLMRKLESDQEVVDLRDDEVRRQDLLGEFFRETGASFMVPVVSRNELDGLVLLSQPINPGEDYDFEDFELMVALAHQVGAAVTNLRLGDELVEAREMEVIGRVATFVLHDLKNQVYPLSLLVENAREYIDEPEFQHDMLASLESIVTKMKVLISQLTHIPKSDNLKQRLVDLKRLAAETIYLVPDSGVSISGGNVEAFIDAEEVQKVVLNLLLNAIEAGEGKPITVEVGDVEGPYIKVTDQGTGIDEKMLKDGLFAPFKSTKDKGMGIGLFQCKQIIEAHGGKIEVFSQSGEGATFVVRFPRPEV